MTLRAHKVVLLGPMNDPGLVSRVVSDVAPSGSIAVIRAGWQEWESDDSILSGALGGRDINLGLHARADRIWIEDPGLMDAHHRMQRAVRTLRGTYNVRLSHLMDAWLELLGRDGPDELLNPERAAALEDIRELDARQRARIAEIREEFAARVHLPDRHAVARERAEVRSVLDAASAVVVDGGHVAVLLNRMRLLGLDELLVGRTVVGISGGAMVLTERLVLFHDSPPWGPGHAEVAESGLGLAPGIVPLPHASKRLKLDDAGRIRRLVRRFAPAQCVLLENGARVVWNGEEWSLDKTRYLTPKGTVSRWGTAA